MKTFQNKKNVHLMIWETNQSKRNLNNEIKFNLPNIEPIEVGDEIHCYLEAQKTSVYKITNIKEVRESSLNGFNYITANSEWFIKTL